MTRSPVTIYHNPACGTSRKALAMIEQAGFAPVIVDYMAIGWTRALLERLMVRMAVGPRDILRAKEPLAAELGLLSARVGDDEILSAMLAHPVLVERPIVVGSMGVRLCRPADRVAELLVAEI